MPTDHTARRAADAVKAAKARWGAGWAHMSKEQRLGAVALRVVYALAIQDEETAAPAVKRLQKMAELALDAVDDLRTV